MSTLPMAVTLDDVDFCVRALTYAYTHGAPVYDRKEALLTLRSQMKSGDYIVLEPDLSGWGFVTCHFEVGDGLRETVRGHKKLDTVVALAQRLGQAVCVVDGLAAWQEQTTRKLVKAGVTVIAFEGDNE